MIGLANCMTFIHIYKCIFRNIDIYTQAYNNQVISVAPMFVCLRLFAVLWVEELVGPEEIPADDILITQMEAPQLQKCGPESPMAKWFSHKLLEWSTSAL